MICFRVFQMSARNCLVGFLEFNHLYSKYGSQNRLWLNNTISVIFILFFLCLRTMCTI